MARVTTALDEVLDQAPCGFVSFSDDGRIVLVNATLLERLGYARAELDGCHVETLLTRPGRLFYQTHFFPLVKMHGRARELFLVLRTKTGEEVGVLCNAVRRTGDDGARTDCVMLELQERRKYEDALLRAKRQAEDATRRLEEQAVELEAQQQQLQDQAAELEAQAETLQVLNNDLIAHGEELERQRAAAVTAERAADAANRAKSEFLAVMSHELRTPLNAIGGYAQLLHGEIYGPISEPQRDALGRIARSQRHLLGLINDILNLARVETGRVDYRIENVAIADVVAELAAMVEPQVEVKHLSYRVERCDQDEGGGGEPLAVRADREKLVQILLNLLSNAIKFTAAGGTITLDCHVGPRGDGGDGAGVVRIEVRDTGRGIPADKLDAIFEPFVQVRSDLTTSHEGTGLGLAISRNLAQGMGGDLTAASELGKGSTFTLTLQRAR